MTVYCDARFDSFQRVYDLHDVIKERAEKTKIIQIMRRLKKAKR